MDARWILGLVLLASCSEPRQVPAPRRPSPEAGPAEPAAPDGGPAAAKAVEKAAPAPPVRPLSPVPERFSALGGPCAPDRAENVAICGGGRVAAIYAPVDLAVGAPPAAAEVVHEESAPPFNRSLLIALEGERIWIRMVTCGSCRRVMGWAFVGDLDKMSDEGLQGLAQRLRLPQDTPLMRTSGEWRSFLQGKQLLRPPPT